MTVRASLYRPDIDGLRAIAVAVVVIFHAWPDMLPGGFIGVDVFFVVSGYLISGIILGGLQAGNFSFQDFYARRIRRIFPALALVLATVSVAGWFAMFAGDYEALGRHVAAGAAFSSNLLLWRESGYFDTASELKPLLHLWSLGIEEQFYLAWPLSLVIAYRWRRGPLLLTLAISVLSFIAAILTVGVDRTAAFYAPWNRFWELLAGAMLACVEADNGSATRLKAFLLRPWIADVMALAGMLSIVAGVALIDGRRTFPGFWALLPVGGTVLLLVAGPQALINRSVLSLPAVVGLGLISYPLYLWHWPLLWFSRINFPDAVEIRVLAIVASVVLAWSTYRGIEWPARFGPSRRIVVPIASTAMVVLAAAGVTMVAAGGFSERSFNRSNAAHLAQYYARMRQSGIATAYRAECDFMDWTTQRSRTAIDPSCTAPGRQRTYFLWGDSYAQALALGIREVLRPGDVLAQVATSACGPQIEPFTFKGPEGRCARANPFALESIGRLRPSLVIVAQELDHAATDWRALSARLFDLGAGGVLVVGPAPRWQPSLPAIFARDHLVAPRPYVAVGLDQRRFEEDRRLSAALAGVPGITYVSLLDRMCRQDGCLAQVPGHGPLDLMAFDSGHLTPQGSAYVGRQLLKPHLDRVP